MQRLLQGKDVLVQESDLLIEQLHLQLVGFRKDIGYRPSLNGNLIIAIELASDGMNTDDAESGAHDIPDVTELTADLVGSGNEVHAQQCCQGMGVDLVGFDLGVADGFKILGMRKDELDAMRFEQVIEPVPARGGFNNGPVVSTKTTEVGQ